MDTQLIFWINGIINLFLKCKTFFFNSKNNFKFLMFETNGNKIRNKIIFFLLNEIIRCIRMFKKFWNFEIFFFKQSSNYCVA